MISPKSTFTIAFAFLLALIAAHPATAQKKEKYAPDNTVILVLGQKPADLDESQFPNLAFYYLPGIHFTTEKTDVYVGIGKKKENRRCEGTPEFIAHLGTASHLADNQYIRGILLDQNGTVAFSGNFKPAHPHNMDETMFSRPGSNKKKPFTDDLKNIVEKQKTAKVDAKKQYVEGQPPAFKGWPNLDGMAFPDFEVQDAAGNSRLLSAVRGGNPMLLFFVHPEAEDEMSVEEAGKRAIGSIAARGAGLKGLASSIAGDRTYSVSDYLWGIENELYRYYPSRKR